MKTKILTAIIGVLFVAAAAEGIVLYKQHKSIVAQTQVLAHLTAQHEKLTGVAIAQGMTVKTIQASFQHLTQGLGAALGGPPPQPFPEITAMFDEAVRELRADGIEIDPKLEQKLRTNVKTGKAAFQKTFVDPLLK
jgi:hypothetical protein